MMTVKMLHCLMQKRKQLIDPKNPKSGMKITFTSCVSVQYCSACELVTADGIQAEWL